MRYAKSVGLVSGLVACLPLLLASPRLASACGGTFCDIGPTAMPVDQTGETIVFWIDDSGPEPFTEAHIQIQYEGDAERFAWIIPVLAAPEVMVGSQALFDNLLSATVPTFITQNRQVGDCSFGGMGCAKADESAGGQFDTNAGEDGNDTGGVDILDRGFAGAFEYVTLTGTSVDEIVTWLDEAGYAQDDEAPPILEQYLEEGFVFVAVKLRSGAEVDAIHPLAIRYPGVEPCIPIRLTRIAAVEDMAIRAMFLGDDRVAPQNWPHVVVNHARIDHANAPATSYPEIVGLAIDEAGGRGFVTEYAGTDAIVPTSNLRNPLWDPDAFVTIEPVDVVDQLTAQGLMSCALEVCEFNHPQVESLLSAWLPAPDGVGEHEFWSCLSCFEADIDLVAWNAAGFAAALDEQIVVPGQHAFEMLLDAEYLTRLYTLLSPHEMTEDPLFHATTGLPTVDPTIVVTRVFDCDGGPTVLELPDGRSVALTDSGNMPDLDLPAAERIERIPMTGPAQVELDNAEQIDEALDAYNEDKLVGPSPNCTVQPSRWGGFLSLFTVFGIAWMHRSGRRRRTSVS